MSKITLTYNSVTYNVYGGKVSYAWKNLLVDKPLQRVYGNSEVQMNGWENPAFNLTFFIPQGSIDSGYLTWSSWNSIVKNRPTNSSKVLLGIQVTDITGSEFPFTSYALNTTTLGTSSIPIVVKSYDLSFSPDESTGAYWWTVNSQLMETSS